MYTTRQAQQLFGKSANQTIRNWIREFQEFFSVNTAPGKGISILMTVEDMQVLTVIAQMKETNRPSDEIYATLKSGQRGEIPSIAPGDLEKIASGDFQKHLVTQRSALVVKIEQLENQLQATLEALTSEREARIRAETKMEGRTEQLQKIEAELKELRQQSSKELTQFIHQLARLESANEVLKKELQQLQGEE